MAWVGMTGFRGCISGAIKGREQVSGNSFRGIWEWGTAEAVPTRAVEDAACVQPPTVDRFFREMRDRLGCSRGLWVFKLFPLECSYCDPRPGRRSTAASSRCPTLEEDIRRMGSLVDLIGIEPMTSSMPWKRAPSCATGPLHTILAACMRCVNPVGWRRLEQNRVLAVSIFVE